MNDMKLWEGKIHIKLSYLLIPIRKDPNLTLIFSLMGLR